jgi:hypothetical protein
MVSTGSDWIPIFNILEDEVAIVLANPEEVKNRNSGAMSPSAGKSVANENRRPSTF